MRPDRIRGYSKPYECQHHRNAAPNAITFHDRLLPLTAPGQPAAVAARHHAGYTGPSFTWKRYTDDDVYCSEAPLIFLAADLAAIRPAGCIGASSAIRCSA